VALPCAFLLKRFQGAPVESSHRQKDLAFSGTVYEIALVVMSAYMAYLTAEVSIIYSPCCSAMTRINTLRASQYLVRLQSEQEGIHK